MSLMWPINSEADNIMYFMYGTIYWLFFSREQTLKLHLLPSSFGPSLIQLSSGSQPSVKETE